jgi:diaminopimelate decarboxylase
VFTTIRPTLPDTAECIGGELVIGGVAASKLAAMYGTPLVVLDAATVRNRAEEWVRASSSWPHGSSVAYACKALCVGGVLQLTLEQGLGADVASAGELAIALRAGVSPADIVLHGNNKSSQELAEAVRAGVGLVVLDAEDELNLLEAAVTAAGARPQGVLVRVNPDIEVETHRYIRTGHAGSKFGVCARTATTMLERASSSPYLDARGIHVHLGSQLMDASPWHRVLTWLGPFVRTLQDRNLPVHVLDIGGGLGIPYLETQSPPTPSTIVACALDTIAQTWAAHGISQMPYVIMEPGRSVVGQAGVTVYSVGVVKSDGPIGYVNVDGGFSDNPRPMLYQAQYRALLANRANDMNLTPWWIAGVHCESGDVLIEDAMLPSPRRGDLLAVAGTGAYTLSMASNYNVHPRPAIVLVDNGTAHCIVRRETLDDVIARDEVLTRRTDTPDEPPQSSLGQHP